MCVCVCIYIYIYREREREKETGRDLLFHYDIIAILYTFKFPAFLGLLGLFFSSST